jgi:hypothetical protein
MVFIATGKTQVEVREKIDNIIYTIEKQGRFDYFMDVREVSQGHWKATLQLFFHKEKYPSDYSKPDVVPQTPHTEKKWMFPK